MYSQRDDHTTSGAYLVLDGHLALAIRSGPAENALFSAEVESLDQFLGIDMSEGHSLSCLISGITNHQPLIPCPYFLHLLFLCV